MQARLEAAEHKLALARVALDAAKKRVRVQREAIGELAASNYANGDPKLMGLAVMLNSTDPAEVTSQMNTIDSLMNKQTELLKDLKEARAQMIAEEAKVEKAKEAVAVQRKEARANLVRRQGLERSAEEAKAEVAKLVVRDRAAQAQAASARRADEAQLSALKKQEDRIRAQILERARRQRAAARAGGGGGFKGSTSTFLQRPVPGVVTSPFGYRRHPIYGYWGLHDGTDFSAPCGTLNRAAGSGTVISRYWSDVYGNRLYLDLGQVNGKNLTVVYNHLSGYRVGVGQHVSRGQVVGYAGTTGWSTGLSPALHRAAQRQPGEPDELPLSRRFPASRQDAAVSFVRSACRERMAPMVKEKGQKLVAQNRKARYDFHVDDTFEAGLVLVGTEVKSLRAGRATLVDGFAEITNGEAFLHGVHIPEYTQGTWTNHEPRRVRKLLLNRHEIDKLESKVHEKGFTLIPLSLYFKDGRAKVEIAVARGKKTYDKRHALAAKQADREKQQALGRQLKGMD